MGFIAAADPASKVAYTFTDVGKLHDAIKSYGYIPLRQDGSQYVVQEFEGGYLLDGAPINVYIDGEWFQGQQEALASYWAAGTVPKPPNSILGLPVVPMPTDVAANQAAYVASQSSSLGLGSLALPAAVGLGLFLLMGKRKTS